MNNLKLKILVHFRKNYRDPKYPQPTKNIERYTRFLQKHKHSIRLNLFEITQSPIAHVDLHKYLGIRVYRS